MQQFIPFEDDWDALEKMRPEALIPYRVGLVPVHEAGQPQSEAFAKASDCVVAAPK
jgi:hypothetical protein